MRLRWDPDDKNKDGRDEETRLIFPRQALDLARRNLPKQVKPLQHSDVVRRIERLLDDMQGKVDTLKDDIANYKFPTSDDDDGPPNHAA